MDDNDKQQFGQLLEDAFAAYGKAMPADDVLLGAWLKALQPFPLFVITKALLAYAEEETKFPPTPVAIAKLCKLMDGRPGVEEAWGIALGGKDDADTVVWTQEIAEAFNACRNTLDRGDEIGARMAFKETYPKLVASARLNLKPAKWFASLGSDKSRHEDVLRAAVAAGLLPAPAVALRLGYSPIDEAEVSEKGQAAIRELMGKLKTVSLESEETMRERLTRLDREATAQRKAELSAQADSHD